MEKRSEQFGRTNGLFRPPSAQSIPPAGYFQNTPAQALHVEQPQNLHSHARSWSSQQMMINQQVSLQNESQPQGAMTTVDPQKAAPSIQRGLKRPVEESDEHNDEDVKNVKKPRRNNKDSPKKPQNTDQLQKPKRKLNKQSLQPVVKPSHASPSLAGQSIQPACSHQAHQATSSSPEHITQTAPGPPRPLTRLLETPAYKPIQSPPQVQLQAAAAQTHGQALNTQQTPQQSPQPLPQMKVGQQKGPMSPPRRDMQMLVGPQPTHQLQPDWIKHSPDEQPLYNLARPSPSSQPMQIFIGPQSYQQSYQQPYQQQSPVSVGQIEYSPAASQAPELESSEYNQMIHYQQTVPRIHESVSSHPVTRKMVDAWPTKFVGLVLLAPEHVSILSNLDDEYGHDWNEVTAIFNSLLVHPLEIPSQLLFQSWMELSLRNLDNYEGIPIQHFSHWSRKYFHYLWRSPPGVY